MINRRHLFNEAHRLTRAQRDLCPQQAKANGWYQKQFSAFLRALYDGLNPKQVALDVSTTVMPDMLEQPVRLSDIWVEEFNLEIDTTSTLSSNHIPNAKSNATVSTPKIQSFNWH